MICPKCGNEMVEKPLKWNVSYICPKCDYELLKDKKSGEIREAQWFGWKGD